MVYNTNKNFQLSNGADLDIVDSFCYLGDTLDAGGGCEAGITARVRAAWRKFLQLLPLLTSLLSSQKRLRWFGHAYRSSGSVNNDVMNLVINDDRGRGLPKKT